MRIRTIAAVAIACLAGSTLALAAPVTKDDAVAMVKKAVAAIKADGPEKAYAEISAPGGKFVDGGTYVVVQAFEGVTLALNDGLCQPPETGAAIQSVGAPCVGIFLCRCPAGRR